MLNLEHVSKSYDGKSVLKDISLEIGDGEIVSILGPSGCGKTTLLNLILGITEADGGKIEFNEEDITRVPMEKRGFNIVFQDYALFPNLNVYQNITYGLKNKPGISSREEVNELIELLGLTEHLYKRIDQLSGGQKQRAALARTLVMKPKILLLDEPLSALDGVIKESIKERIKTIARQYNLTTIIVTHDPEEALTLSDRVLIINEGKISQYGRPEEIIQKPENSFVQKFILNQLEIKRNNIFSVYLFYAECADAAVCVRRFGKDESKTQRTLGNLRCSFCLLCFVSAGTCMRAVRKIFSDTAGHRGTELYFYFYRSENSGRTGKQLWSFCHRRRNHDFSGVFTGLCCALYPAAEGTEKLFFCNRTPAHVFTHDYLWLCYLVFFWKTGTFDQTVWPSAV